MMNNHFVSIGFKTFNWLFLGNPVKTLFVARIEHPKPLSTTKRRKYICCARISLAGYRLNHGLRARTISECVLLEFKLTTAVR